MKRPKLWVIASAVILALSTNCAIAEEPTDDTASLVEIRDAAVQAAPTMPLGENPYETPQEIGFCCLDDDLGRVQPMQLMPELRKEDAERAAIQFFMAGYGFPAGMGIEELVVKRSTTALFSGLRGGGLGTPLQPWDIANREVWVVVLTDLPIALPCGPPRPNPCKDVDPPQVNLVVDAKIGEILSGRLTGGGPYSAKWTPIIEKIVATQR